MIMMKFIREMANKNLIRFYRCCLCVLFSFLFFSSFFFCLHMNTFEIPLSLFSLLIFSSLLSLRRVYHSHIYSAVDAIHIRFVNFFHLMLPIFGEILITDTLSTAESHSF